MGVWYHVSMNVYFVRHGKSKGNIDKIYNQSDNIELSENGIGEVYKLAERFRDLKIDSLLTSPNKRALQTAFILGKKLNVEPQEEILLQELRRPSELQGKKEDDIEVTRIENIIQGKYNDRSFRYSDEENFYDLQNRAKKVISALENQNAENILVVSHKVPIRMFVAEMIFGELLSPSLFLQLREATDLYNASVTLCVYTSKWKLRYWNDISHL